MFARYVFGAAFTAATIGAACAEAEPEYYVIQDATSQTCTIVDRRPERTDKNVVQVGPVAFKSRGEAEAGVKTIKACAGN